MPAGVVHDPVVREAEVAMDRRMVEARQRPVDLLAQVLATMAPETADANAANAARMIDAPNTTVNPWWNGPEMRLGKNSRPVRVCAWAAGSADRTCGPSSSRGTDSFETSTSTRHGWRKSVPGGLISYIELAS